MGNINNKILGRAAVSALVTAACSLGVVQIGSADTDRDACSGLVGTYVTTVTDREGVFSSRGLMTFTASGVLLVNDSAQGGVPGIWDPFSATQGTWDCVEADQEKLTVNAVGLNFVLPKNGRTASFGRVDYQANLDVKTGTLSGGAVLSISPGNDLEGIDPIAKPGRMLDEFQFEGKRLALEK